MGYHDDLAMAYAMKTVREIVEERKYCESCWVRVATKGLMCDHCASIVVTHTVVHPPLRPSRFRAPDAAVKAVIFKPPKRRC